MAEFKILEENNEREIVGLTNKLLSDYSIKEEHVYQENNEKGELVNIFTFSELYGSEKGYEDYNGLRAKDLKSKKGGAPNVRKFEDLKEFWDDRFFFMLNIPYGSSSFEKEHLRDINDFVSGYGCKIQGFESGNYKQNEFKIHVPVTTVKTGSLLSKKSYRIYDTLHTCMHEEEKRNARVIVPIDSLVVEKFRESVGEIYSVLKK